MDKHFYKKGAFFVPGKEKHMDQNIKENVQKYLQESRKEIKKSTEVILVGRNGKQIVVIG